TIDEVFASPSEMPTPSFEMAPQDLIKGIEEVATDEEVKKDQKKSPFFRRRERFYWLGSIAALLIVGIFTVISVARSGEDKVDDVIAYYNQWAVNSARGGADELPDLSALKGEELTSAISSLRDTYENPKRSMQDREMAGFSLAIYYLQKHNRKEAIKLLSDMTVTFADDPEFVDSCREVLRLLE
ncbi:MAG: hypothetical protein K2G69_07845, partial [Muribaculaceae bacterium]|nr:hypothetical protein [Muribaculaceae bacterium]